MTRPRPSLLTLVLLAALVLPVAGCTSRTTAAPDPTEVATPVVTGAPSPTATPSAPTYAVPTEPARPAAMDTVDVAGAIATAEYFMQLYPYAYATGDLTAVRGLSHPECIFCKSVDDDVTQMYEGLGHHTEGLGIQFLSSSGSELDPGVAFAVEARVEQQSYRELDAAGQVIDSFDGIDTFSMTFSIVREGTRWLVREAETNDE